MYLGVPLSHFAVEQKSAQHYKSAILQQINKIPKQNQMAVENNCVIANLIRQQHQF